MFCAFNNTLNYVYIFWFPQFLQAVNDVLAIALHFCQLAPLVWLCLEAVYFTNTVYPIFNYENTNTRKFYVSLGWGKEFFFFEIL